MRAGDTELVVRGAIGRHYAVLRVPRAEQGGPLGWVVESEDHGLPGRLDGLLELHPIVLEHHHTRDGHLVRGGGRAGAGAGAGAGCGPA